MAHRNCACGCCAGAQLRELLRGDLLLEDRLHLLGDGAGGGAVVLLREIEDVDLLALLHEDAGLRLLAQRALGDEGREPLRRLVVRVPRVGGQRVVHRLHHVRHRVQAHDVRGAEGGALGAPDRRAR